MELPASSAPPVTMRAPPASSSVSRAPGSAPVTVTEPTPSRTSKVASASSASTSTTPPPRSAPISTSVAPSGASGSDVVSERSSPSPSDDESDEHALATRANTTSSRAPSLVARVVARGDRDDMGTPLQHRAHREHAATA